MKVSIVCPTHRPGYIDTLGQALKDQTLPKDEWELVLVDELYDMRKDLVPPLMPFNLKHIRQEPSPRTQGTRAQNLGLRHCEGELVYFMCDYNYPHPRCLERHWEIYQRYGPKVFISGPLVDGITFSGRSLAYGAEPVMLELKLVSEGGVCVVYPEAVPPVPLELKAGYETPSPDNLLSIFKAPFVPVWKWFPPDWRVAQICSVSVAKGLYECLAGPQWWWTRNDSAPKADLGEGMPEAGRMIAGEGTDTLMIKRLVEKGYRYLVDREAPSYILPHPWRKTLA